MLLESEFGQIALILLVAAVAGYLAHLARQPVLVAYILVGILLGPAVFGFVADDAVIEGLAKVGIAILLFLVGLKLDIGLIKSTGLVALLTGVGQVVFTSVIGFFIILALGFDVIPAIYISVALTFSSTIIIVKLLSDKRELDQLHGRIAVGFLIVQDILVVVAMIVIVTIGQPDGAEATRSPWLVLIGSLVFLLTVALLARFVIPRVMAWFARSSEVLLLFGVGWAMTLAGVSEALGLSMEIGAFVAGVALASSPYREGLGSRTVSLRDVMILFFFIQLGASLTFDDAIAQLWPALILSLFVLIGNPLIVMVIMGYLGYRSRVSFKAGLAVAQISEFSLILIALGFSLGQVENSVLSLVTLVGVITITVSTYFILYSDPIYDRLSGFLRLFEFRTTHVSESEDSISHPFDAIIVGAGRLGSSVTAGLLQKNANLLVVDSDPEALKKLKQRRVTTLYGDISDADFASSLPLNETDAIICTVQDRSTNLVLLETLGRFGFEGSICLTAMDEPTAKLFQQNPGVTVIKPLKMAAHRIVDNLPEPRKRKDLGNDR
jgi:Kef-type K+ transport system membrane component KefB